jgi:DNA-binding NtrC family response regulator
MPASALQEYQWPGNVRELQHVIERAVILTPDPIIQPHCLEGTRFGLAHSLNAPGPRGPRAAVMGALGGTPAVSAAAVPTPPGAGRAGTVVLESLDVAAAERVLIDHALEASAGNRTKAAELLGISVRTLRNKLNGPGAKGDEDEALV